jgi:hypothetical protein
MKTAKIAPRLRGVTFGESRCNCSIAGDTIVENTKAGVDAPQTDLAFEFSTKPPAGGASNLALAKAAPTRLTQVKALREDHRYSFSSRVDADRRLGLPD